MAKKDGPVSLQTCHGAGGNQVSLHISFSVRWELIHEVCVSMHSLNRKVHGDHGSPTIRFPLWSFNGLYAWISFPSFHLFGCSSIPITPLLLRSWRNSDRSSFLNKLSVHSSCFSFQYTAKEPCFGMWKYTFQRADEKKITWRLP